MSSPLKLLEQFSPDFTWVERILIICLTGFAPLNKMATMPIFGKKTLKNLLLQNQESFKAESWYIALGTQGLPSLVK